jgi:hypothetical protein
MKNWFDETWLQFIGKTKYRAFSVHFILESDIKNGHASLIAILLSCIFCLDKSKLMSSGDVIYKKIQNAGLMAIGIVTAVVSLWNLFHHRYSIYYAKGRAWVPTIAPLLCGAWLFVIGLIGFINDTRVERPNSLTKN